MKQKRNSLVTLNPVQMEARDAIIKKFELGEFSLTEYACQICKKIDRDSDYRELLSEDRYGIYSPVVICRNCGLIRTSKILTALNVPEFYMQYYRRLYTGSAEASDEVFFEQNRRGIRLKKFIGKELDLNDITVVEVGAGAGGVIGALTNFSKSSFACDLGDEFLKYARNLGMNTHRGTLADFTENFADLIVYSHVFEHIEDIDAELATIKRVLRPGGYLLIEVPGVFQIHKHYQSDFRLCVQSAHFNYFTAKHLKHILCSSGFQTIKINEDVKALFQVREENGSVNCGHLNSLKQKTIFYLYVLRIFRPILKFPYRLLDLVLQIVRK